MPDPPVRLSDTSLPGYGWALVLWACICGWHGNVLVTRYSRPSCPNCGRRGPQ